MREFTDLSEHICSLKEPILDQISQFVILVLLSIIIDKLVLLVIQDKCVKNCENLSSHTFVCTQMLTNKKSVVTASNWTRTNSDPSLPTTSDTRDGTTLLSN